MESMFNRNSDGAGFAITNKEGFTEWHKGYMSFDEFYKKLTEFKDDVLKENEVALHFRITTKGNTDPETTHPFPLSSRFDDMRTLHGITKSPVVFHNGTISGFGGIASDVSSDTQDFIMGPLYYILKGAKNFGALRKTAVEQLLGASRLLILNHNKGVTKLGDWTMHTDGCYYSNMLWKPSPTYITYTTPVWTATKEVPKAKKNTEPDEYGCHSYPGVWPAQDKHWIEFESEKIKEKALATLIKGKDRYGDTYRLPVSNMKYYDIDELTIATEEGKTMMNELYSEEVMSLADEYSDDDYISFSSYDDMTNTLDSLPQTAEGTYLYKDTEWYADLSENALYSKSFMEEYYDEEERPMAIQSLLIDGTLPPEDSEESYANYLGLSEEEMEEQADLVAKRAEEEMLCQQ